MSHPYLSKYQSPNIVLLPGPQYSKNPPCQNAAKTSQDVCQQILLSNDGSFTNFMPEEAMNISLTNEHPNKDTDYPQTYKGEPNHSRCLTYLTPTVGIEDCKEITEISSLKFINDLTSSNINENSQLISTCIPNENIKKLNKNSMELKINEVKSNMNSKESNINSEALNISSKESNMNSKALNMNSKESNMNSMESKMNDNKSNMNNNETKSNQQMELESNSQCSRVDTRQVLTLVKKPTTKHINTIDLTEDDVKDEEMVTPTNNQKSDSNMIQTTAIVNENTIDKPIVNSNFKQSIKDNTQSKKLELDHGKTVLTEPDRVADLTKENQRNITSNSGPFPKKRLKTIRLCITLVPKKKLKADVHENKILSSPNNVRSKSPDINLDFLDDLDIDELADCLKNSSSNAENKKNLNYNCEINSKNKSSENTTKGAIDVGYNTMKTDSNRLKIGNYDKINKSEAMIVVSHNMDTAEPIDFHKEIELEQQTERDAKHKFAKACNNISQCKSNQINKSTDVPEIHEEFDKKVSDVQFDKTNKVPAESSSVKLFKGNERKVELLPGNIHENFTEVKEKNTCAIVESVENKTKFEHNLKKRTNSNETVVEKLIKKTNITSDTIIQPDKGTIDNDTETSRTFKACEKNDNISAINHLTKTVFRTENSKMYEKAKTNLNKEKKASDLNKCSELKNHTQIRDVKFVSQSLLVGCSKEIHNSKKSFLQVYRDIKESNKDKQTPTASKPKPQVAVVKPNNFKVTNNVNQKPLKTKTETTTQVVKTYTNRILIKELNLSAGQMLVNRYTVINLIQEGKYSDIVKVKDKIHDTYAMKILKPRRQSDCVDQLWLLQQLQGGVPNANRHCISLCDNFVYNGRKCILMEFFPFTLDEVSPVPVEAAQALAKQLISAVVMLRNNDIMHTDIRPGHIVVSGDRRWLKLCGFDAAVWAPEARPPPHVHLGPHNYRAPELLLGVTPDYAIDVWSVACVMYELTVGRQLFEGHSGGDVLFRQMRLLGKPDQLLLRRGAHTHHYFDQDGHFLRHIHNRKGKRVVRKVSWIPQQDMILCWMQKAQTQQWPQRECAASLSALHRLLRAMLEPSPRSRLTIEFALANPFIYQSE